MLQDKTIAAIATPYGTGGIAVIRVSGGDAFAICDKVFENPKNKKIMSAKSHTILYGFIVDGGKKIDEVLVSVMKAPHTFTKEDTVEISCHGGIVVTKEVLSAVIKHGAVLADPGEFTKRAFLSGRLDLSQAEAVIDVINSRSALALETATHQLEGTLSKEIGKVREELLDIISQINALVDYPEEDIEELTMSRLREKLEDSRQTLQQLLSSAHKGKMIRDGIDTAIIGKPNVGKSSLLNALSGENRAIVTDIAGTTRDVIEQQVDLGPVSLNVFDTAGIRRTEDVIETIGIEKSKEYLKNAQLVLFLLDTQTGITQEDLEIAAELTDKNVVILVNKIDVKNDIDTSTLPLSAPVIPISAKQNIGLDTLINTILQLFDLGAIEKYGGKIITNLRHKQALSHGLEHICTAIGALDSFVPLDMISIDITNAITSLGEITGQTVSEEIVDRIFSRFCLGK